MDSSVSDTSTAKSSTINNINNRNVIEIEQFVRSTFEHEAKEDTALLKPTLAMLDQLNSSNNKLVVKLTSNLPQHSSDLQLGSNLIGHTTQSINHNQIQSTTSIHGPSTRNIEQTVIKPQSKQPGSSPTKKTICNF